MKAAIIDPQCSTCHGRGYVIASDDEQPCPGCRLRARYEKRWCDSCHTDKPIDGMRFVKEASGNDYAICAECCEAADAAHEAAVEAQYWDAYGDDVKGLAVYQVEGR